MMRATIISLVILGICMMGSVQSSIELGSKDIAFPEAEGSVSHKAEGSVALEAEGSVSHDAPGSVRAVTPSVKNITCYSCQGYIPSERSDDQDNSVECTGHFFSAIAIGEELLKERRPNTETLACVRVSIQDDDWNNGTEWVLRAGDKYMDIEWTKEARKEHWIKMALKQIPNYSGKEEFDVDFCYTDKCNGAMHTVAASMLVVVLPLLTAIRMF